MMITVYMDIDGTLADISGRLLLAGPEPKERGPAYTKWLKRMLNPKLMIKDPKIKGMRQLCDIIDCTVSTELVYLTGRSESHREVTRQWLDDNGFPPATLIMRPKNSSSKNGVLKERLILEDKPQGIVMVVDDDPNGDIEGVCKSNGWTFLKARSGS